MDYSSASPDFAQEILGYAGGLQIIGLYHKNMEVNIMSKISKPKVSIVTISFNQASFIEQAIRSVLSQNYENIEYIVVDAGSTDGSRDIIQKYKDDLAEVIFEPDDGPADGLNKGFSRATGDIFYYLNADDVLLPGALTRAVKCFENMPEVDVIYGNCILIDKTGSQVRRIFGNRWDLTAFVYGAVSVTQQSTFIRGTAFSRSGPFNKNNRTCWDTELIVDLALNGCCFKYVSEYFGAFRVYENSITGSGRLQREIQNDLVELRKRVLKRDPIFSDIFLFFYFRVLKNISEPFVVLKKIMDYIAPPHNKGVS